MSEHNAVGGVHHSRIEARAAIKELQRCGLDKKEHKSPPIKYANTSHRLSGIATPTLARGGQLVHHTHLRSRK